MYRRKKKEQRARFWGFLQENKRFVKEKERERVSEREYQKCDFLCTIVIVFISYCIKVVLLHKRNALLYSIAHAEAKVERRKKEQKIKWDQEVSVCYECILPSAYYKYRHTYQHIIGTPIVDCVTLFLLFDHFFFTSEISVSSCVVPFVLDFQRTIDIWLKLSNTHNTHRRKQNRLYDVFAQTDLDYFDVYVCYGSEQEREQSQKLLHIPNANVEDETTQNTSTPNVDLLKMYRRLRMEFQSVVKNYYDM